MMDSAEFTHIPVLAEQTVSILSETPRPLKRLIDCKLLLLHQSLSITFPLFCSAQRQKLTEITANKHL